MADRPEKTNYSPGHSIFSPYLLLPSFGIRLARSAPESLVLPRGSGTADIASPESGDAFSVSYYLTTIEIVAAQDFIPLDEARLRRLLLEILSREEYSDIVEHYATQDRAELIHEGTPEGGGWSFKHRKEDPTPQVRITDLRLAMNLKPALFRRELKSVLENLERPITTNGVLQWKLETLRRYKNPPKDPRGILDRFEFAEEGNRLKAVSFAAAALLLLVDLDARKVRQAGVDELAQRIETLYEVVRSLAESLDASTKSLSKLLAGKDPNRPRDPEAKYYNALVLYRMGRSLHTVAERVGITPNRPRKLRDMLGMPEGPRNWKGQVRERIRRGVEIEAQRFPQAAEIFHRRHEEDVQNRAAEAYRDYFLAAPSERQMLMDLGFDEGDDLLGGIPAEEGLQVGSAYVQLGCCLDNDRDPFEPA